MISLPVSNTEISLFNLQPAKSLSSGHLFFQKPGYFQVSFVTPPFSFRNESTWIECK